MLLEEDAQQSSLISMNFCDGALPQVLRVLASSAQAFLGAAQQDSSFSNNFCDDALPAVLRVFASCAPARGCAAERLIFREFQRQCCACSSACVCLVQDASQALGTDVEQVNQVATEVQAVFDSPRPPPPPPLRPPPVAPPPSDSKILGLDMPIFIGVVVGAGTVLLGIVAVIIYCFMKRRASGAESRLIYPSSQNQKKGMATKHPQSRLSARGGINGSPPEVVPDGKSHQMYAVAL